MQANIFRDRNEKLHQKLEELQRLKSDRKFCILADQLVDITRDGDNGGKVDLFDHTKTLQIFSVPDSREECVLLVVEEILRDLGLDHHRVRCVNRIRNYYSLIGR